MLQQWVVQVQVAYAVIALILNTRNTKKLLNYGFLSQVRDLLPYLLCSLIMMSVALGLDYVVGSSWIVLGLCLIICPAVYLLLCYVFKLTALNEMASILASNRFCPVWLNRILTKLSPES